MHETDVESSTCGVMLMLKIFKFGGLFELEGLSMYQQAHEGFFAITAVRRPSVPVCHLISKVRP